MNINCPDCKKKLGENETGIIDVKSNVRIVFESSKMAFTCPCGFIGQYDAVGGVWVTDVSAPKGNIILNEWKDYSGN